MAILKREFSYSASDASDARVANALEFIAHYLDRIEGHLAQLASAPTLSSLEGIRLQLAKLAETVDQRVRM